MAIDWFCGENKKQAGRLEVLTYHSFFANCCSGWPFVNNINHINNNNNNIDTLLIWSKGHRMNGDRLVVWRKEDPRPVGCFRPVVCPGSTPLGSSSSANKLNRFWLKISNIKLKIVRLILFQTSCLPRVHFTWLLVVCKQTEQILIENIKYQNHKNG